VQGWTSNNFHTYVLLEDGADIAAIQSQSAAFFERHFREGSSEFTGFTAYALPDIHLRSNRGFEIGTPGSIGKLWGFGAVAILILLIASMNFVNLATARSVQRAKEIGVRKVVGADRSRIIVQFLGESMLVTLLAVIIAAGIVALTLPVFSTVLEKNLTLTFFGDGTILPTLAALVLTVGLVAGSYPALYLSSFEPARVLKGNLTRGVSAARSRKLFVVLQFAISITLTIATAVVYSQMRFAETIELGYNKDRIVILSGTTTRGLGESWDTFKERLLAHPEITHATASQLTPGVPNTDSTGLRHEGGDSDDRPMPFMFIDFDFFETFQIDLLAGRTFSEKFAADGMTAPTEGVAGREAAFMINGLAARQLGWTPTSAIGKWLEVGFFDTRGEIVGVVADVYFESVRRAMKPLVFMIPPAEMFGVPALREASLRITGRDLANTLAYIDSTWAEFVPGTPIGRRFLDDDLQTLYQDERRQAQILTFFSTLAIVVACLGLFGVGLFTSERRTKEIGIRKAMGGSVWSIVALLTAEFSKLVVVAFLLAWPIAYVAMSAWLESFAYRVDLNPFVFLGSGLLALLIAWLTVGGVAARAAMIKPARALRYE
jgi:putative ABC transport system permease protein